jgi:hypothetical protein
LHETITHLDVYTMRPFYALLLTLFCACAHQTYSDGMRALEAGNAKRAITIWEPLAESGNWEAARAIADVYMVGKPDVPKNQDQYLRWILKAAEGGNPGVQYRAAMTCGDPVLHAELLRRAAMQGHDWAQDWLWQAYMSGEGVPKDWEEAFFWALHVQARNGPITPITIEEIEHHLGPTRAAVVRRRASESWMKMQEKRRLEN